MGKLFGEKLRDWRKAHGVSSKALIKDSGLDGGNLGAIERGARRPSDTNLEALAKVEQLGAQVERLRAWRAADDIAEDLHLLVPWAPELLGLPVQQEAPANETPAFNPFAALAGDEPPPLDDQELAAVAELATLVGDLAAYSPAYRPNGQGWRQPAGARLSALRAMVEEAREDAVRAKQVKAKERA
jgi:transcriptional regulator with XRE-family HTH domain